MAIETPRPGDGSFKFKLKCTFIDVQPDTLDALDDFPFTGRPRPRSASWSGPACADKDPSWEDTYVSSLAEKLQTWYADRQRRDLFRSAPAVTQERRAATVQPGKVQTASSGVIANPAVEGMKGNIRHLISEIRQDVIRNERAMVAEATKQLSKVPLMVKSSVDSSLAEADRPSDPLAASALLTNHAFQLPLVESSQRALWGDIIPNEDDVDVLTPHPPPPPVYGGCNRGSLGHPVLCNRSCRFFADGLCENGDDCNFCHMEHGKRPVHLSKKMREMWKTLQPRARMGIVAGVLQEKIMGLSLGPDAMTALWAWRRQVEPRLGPASPTAILIPSSYDLKKLEYRKLRTVMMSSSFHTLCGMVHAVGEVEGDGGQPRQACQATQTLLETLRGNFVARQIGVAGLPQNTPTSSGSASSSS
jgi:hypothetical protein